MHIYQGGSEVFLGSELQDPQPGVSAAFGVRHIQTPEDPDVSWCGATRKNPNGRRYSWNEVRECDVCSMCLSYPGAKEYAMGGAA